MLFSVFMKTTLALVLASLTAVPALADNAPISPDFVSAAPRLHIDRSLVASPAMNRIEPLDIVAFTHDSAFLSGGSITQVDRAAKWLLNHPRHRIVLEGHTDTAGPDPYNTALATRRMESVRNRLMGWGVPSDRIVLITYGEARATAPEDPEDRRVVMFATQQPARAVVANQLEHRDALIATWTERGSILQMQNGIAREVPPPAPSVISRR